MISSAFSSQYGTPLRARLDSISIGNRIVVSGDKNPKVGNRRKRARILAVLANLVRFQRICGNRTKS
jgi:hypothetical protein